RHELIDVHHVGVDQSLLGHLRRHSFRMWISEVMSGRRAAHWHASHVPSRLQDAPGSGADSSPRSTRMVDEALTDFIHRGWMPRLFTSTVLASTPPAPTVRR